MTGHVNAKDEKRHSTMVSIDIHLLLEVAGSRDRGYYIGKIGGFFIGYDHGITHQI
jgi:hypothetical protein